MIHQEQGTPLREGEGEQGLPAGSLKDAGVGQGEGGEGRGVGHGEGALGTQPLGTLSLQQGVAHRAWPRAPHRQLSLQTGSGAQHRGHHVIGDREVLWEGAAAADQDRVEAIQELGGEEGVFLPVLINVLCGGGEVGTRSRSPSGWSCPRAIQGSLCFFIPFSGQPLSPVGQAVNLSFRRTCPTVYQISQGQDSAGWEPPRVPARPQPLPSSGIWGPAPPSSWLLWQSRGSLSCTLSLLLFHQVALTRPPG